ncbi:MAG: chemotaxis protein CheW [Planctomycetaceae bacterium]
MQLLTFTVAGQTYAIESRRVIEVLPLVPARPIPHTPDYIRGIFTYRGRLVPLVDLAVRLAVGKLQERLSTRVIVVEYAPGGREPQQLGLVAENVISIRSAAEAEASLPPLEFRDAAFLGRILRIGGRTIQLLAVEHLLPSEVSSGLFPAPPTVLQ